MKRLFSLLMVLTLAAALCLPVWADDSNPDSGINNGGDTSTVTTDNQGVYVTGYTVTTPAGGEITTLTWAIRSTSCCRWWTIPRPGMP